MSEHLTIENKREVKLKDVNSRNVCENHSTSPGSLEWKQRDHSK